MPEFAELKRLNAREYWKDEALNFTPWLADEGNLAKLGDALEIDLKSLETEKSVGDYSLDILAEEDVTQNGRKVVIENQLSDSDHNHLGKTIAYASGVDADVVVWIAPRFHDEHIDAIQWLNNNSREGIDFFAVRLEVYQIEDSPPAVRFNPVEKPSEWKDRAKRVGQLSETRKLQEKFWTKFRDKITESDTNLRPRKPRPRTKYGQPMGHGEYTMSLAFNTVKNRLYCTLIIRNNASLFERLKQKQDKIENKLDPKENELVEWISPDETSGENERGKVRISRAGHIDKEENWNKYQRWLLDRGSNFKTLFKDTLQQIS